MRKAYANEFSPGFAAQITRQSKPTHMAIKKEPLGSFNFFGYAAGVSAGGAVVSAMVSSTTTSTRFA